MKNLLVYLKIYNTLIKPDILYIEEQFIKLSVHLSDLCPKISQVIKQKSEVYSWMRKIGFKSQNLGEIQFESFNLNPIIKFCNRFNDEI